METARPDAATTEAATAEAAKVEAATTDAAMADGAMAEAMAEAMAAVMAAMMVVAWDVTARDKNKHHGGRRGGKALLTEFLPNLRRRLPDCQTHELDKASDKMLMGVRWLEEDSSKIHYLYGNDLKILNHFHAYFFCPCI